MTNHPALQILEDLISIQSVNPALEAGGAGERAYADYLEARLTRAGLKVSRHEVLPGRENIVAELRVGKPEKTLLFESHMDTASIGTMENPLVPTYRDGRLYGRGSCDTKGTAAGMLYAIEQAAKHPESLPGDLVYCGAIDEEFGFAGANALARMEMPIVGAVVGEPTELRIIYAHKGIARFSVSTHGRAAHSSVPHEGDSAIFQMVRVLEFIRDAIEPELAAVRHPLLSSPTIVVGTVHGGSQVNIVPESCEIQIDRRVLPGEDPAEVLAEFESRLAAEFAGTSVKATVGKLLLDHSLNTSLDAPVLLCAQAVAAKLGFNPEPCAVPYGTDASKLQGIKGVPTIVFGPGSIAQAHTREEFVPVVEVERAAEFYWELARAFGEMG